MIELFKSTTNTITVFVVMATAFMVIATLFLPINPIPAEVWGAWGAIVGWVIGAKSQKSKYQESDIIKTQESIEIPEDIKNIINS